VEWQSQWTLGLHEKILQTVLSTILENLNTAGVIVEKRARPLVCHSSNGCLLRRFFFGRIGAKAVSALRSALLFIRISLG
jgi:hypothetical protein